MLAPLLIFALFASTLFLIVGWIADLVVASQRKKGVPIDSDLAFGWESKSHRGRPMPAAR